MWRLAGCVGGNVCESNTSKTFCTPHNGFEDRGAHRSPSVPKRGGILPNAQCRATKTAHLLRLTSKGKPYPLFRNIGKSSTCGFVFAVFEMVEGSHLNVVDRPVSWRGMLRDAHGPTHRNYAGLRYADGADGDDVCPDKTDQNKPVPYWQVQNHAGLRGRTSAP